MSEHTFPIYKDGELFGTGIWDAEGKVKLLLTPEQTAELNKNGNSIGFMYYTTESALQQGCKVTGVQQADIY